jgi:hypothetical protein
MGVVFFRWVRYCLQGNQEYCSEIRLAVVAYDKTRWDL